MLGGANSGSVMGVAPGSTHGPSGANIKPTCEISAQPIEHSL